MHHQLRLSPAQSSPDLTDLLTRVQLDCLQVEHLDGDHLLGLVVHALVDRSEGAPADLIVDDILADGGIGDGLAHLPVLVVGELQLVVRLHHTQWVLI